MPNLLRIDLRRLFRLSDGNSRLSLRRTIEKLRPQARRQKSVTPGCLGISYRLTAFSLIEISIVLIIIGLITTAVFKGQDLIESARVQASVDELNRIRLAIMTYKDQFGYLPGNDSHAQQHFGSSVSNGDGFGLIHGPECQQTWQHLKQAGLVDQTHAPICKLGGFITVTSNPTQQHPGNWLVISNTSDKLSPALTPKQAFLLKSRIGDPSPDEGQLIIQSAPGLPKTDCHNGQAFNLKNKSPACIAMMKL